MKNYSVKISCFILLISLVALACKKERDYDSSVQGVIIDSSDNHPLTGSSVTLNYKLKRSLFNSKFLLDNKVSDRSGKFLLLFNSADIDPDYLFELTIKKSDDYFSYQTEVEVKSWKEEKISLETIKLRRQTKFIIHYENKIAPINIKDELSFYIGKSKNNMNTGFTGFFGNGEVTIFVDPDKKYYFKSEIKKANGFEQTKIDSSEFIWKRANELKIDY